MDKCCGTCKWFAIPEKFIRKGGGVYEKQKNFAYECKVPFEPNQHVPACYRWEAYRTFMCAYHGAFCAYHEPRG